MPVSSLDNSSLPQHPLPVARRWTSSPPHRLLLVHWSSELRPRSPRGSSCPRGWTSSLMQLSIPYLSLDVGPVILPHLLLVHWYGELQPAGPRGSLCPPPPYLNSHEQNTASPTCLSTLDQFSSLWSAGPIS